MDLAAQYVHKILRNFSCSNQPHIELLDHFSVVVLIFLTWNFPKESRLSSPKQDKSSQISNISKVPLLSALRLISRRQERGAFAELRPTKSYLQEKGLHVGGLMKGCTSHPELLAKKRSLGRLFKMQACEWKPKCMNQMDKDRKAQKTGTKSRR